MPGVGFDAMDEVNSEGRLQRRDDGSLIGAHVCLDTVVREKAIMNPSTLHNSANAGGLSAMRALEGANRIRAALGRAMMVKTPTASFAICLGLAWLGLAHVAQAAEDQRARENVERVGRLFISQTSIANVEMQIIREDWQRNIWMQFWSRGESHILVRIRQPPEDAGTAMLKVGNKAWQYLPKANRTVEISGSMLMTPFMGSHFTLNDLVNQSRLTNDYVVATSFEGRRGGVAVSEYTLTPKPAAAVVWGRITLEIRQADLMPLRQLFYDEEGKLVRELSFSEFKTVSGRLIPTRLVMRPMDEAHRNERTTITYQYLIFDHPIGDETFSLQNLKP
jgi:outer membrane lipoprotein-sorting protein